MSDVEFDLGNHEYWCSSLRNDGSGDFGKCNCKAAMGSEALRTKILPAKAFKILDAALKAGKDEQQ